MNKRSKSPAYYFGWVCSALLAYLIYLNVVPHWSFDAQDFLLGLEENNWMVTLTPSLQELLWLPKPTNSGLVDALLAGLSSVPEDIKPNLIFQQFIALPIAAFLAAQVGIIINAINGHKWFASLFTIISGLATFITFSFNELFTMELYLVDTASIGTFKTVGLIVAIAGVVHLALALLPILLKKNKKAPVAEA